MDDSHLDGHDGPTLHIDSDWKAEAERERQRLAQVEEQERARRESAGRGELPEPDFRGLVSMLASQALMGLGTMADPETRGVIVDLEGSRFAIDLLGVMEEKTRGNLTEQESSELTQALGALRARYVEIARLVAEQMAAGPFGGGPEAAEAGGGGGVIIDPTA
jgi:hypothetical protein